MNKFCNKGFVCVFWSSLNVRMGLSGEVVAKLNFHMGKSVVFFFLLYQQVHTSYRIFTHQCEIIYYTLSCCKYFPTFFDNSF